MGLKRWTAMGLAILCCCLAGTALAQVEAFGQWVEPEAESLVIDPVVVEDMEALVACLDQLPRLSQVDMYDSRLDKEQRGMLTQRYPNIRFGWTLIFSTYQIRTDATAFSTKRGQNNTHRFTSRQFEMLKYCYQMEALDLGHQAITSLNFLKYFPNLKVLILADNDITDISPIAQLEKLEYLELFMNEIKDVSPLAELKSLKDVNIAYNKVNDLSPLYGLEGLERLWASHNKLKAPQKEEARSALPDCQIDFAANTSTGSGWRRHARYWVIKEIFDSGSYRPLAEGEGTQP